MSESSGPVVAIPPSGGQVELRWGGHRAVVVEVSGGLREYEVDGRALVDGYGERAMSSGGRGQLLVPWPNRLRDGRYDFAGTSHQVALTEPGRGNAIHGFLRWESWHVADREPHRAVLEHTLHPRSGYPFAVSLAAEYRLGDDGLTVTLSATNVGADACPFGAGAHPYLRAGDGPIDDWWVEAPGATRLITDERGIPVGREQVSDTASDFRRRRVVGTTVLDTAFTDAARDPDGLAWVRLWDGQAREGVGLWMDPTNGHYMLFTGDSLPDPAERRRSIAVEPMTCAPNAFASGDGLVVLAPGESLTTRWGIAPLGPP